MIKNKKIKLKTPGSLPGTLIYTGNSFDKNIKIELFEIIEEKYFQKNINNLIELKDKLRENKNLKWLNVSGLGDVNRINQIGQEIGIDNLTLEDILNVNQRSKIEFFENYIFIVVKMYSINQKTNLIESEQVSIILKEDILVTFHEDNDSFFDPIRQRIKTDSSLVRKKSSDYLLYIILDLIMDHYLLILDKTSDEIDSIDEKLNEKKYSENISTDIYQLKQKISRLRKGFIPNREIVNGLLKIENNIVKKETRKYFRDLFDHSLIINENLDTQRETLSEILSLYQNYINNNMNETMKILTIIATIFIPLTFIAGVYGMNFKFMPELYWKYGYFIILGFMAILGSFMTYYFKKKSWL